MQNEIAQGLRNEGNARQLVQKEPAVMKDEIKHLKMGSDSTVCIEASTGVGLGSGTVARPPLRLDGMILNSRKWNSKVGSQITPRVAFKELQMTR